MSSWLLAIILFVATLPGSMGIILLKKGMNKFSKKNPINMNIIIGAGLFGITTLIYLLALRFGNLSLVYPLTSFSYIWIALLSHKYLNEKLSINKKIGIFLIFFGSVLLSF